MNTITKLFLRGLAAILPIALTVYLLYAVGKGAEDLIGSGLQWILPEGAYVRGLGLLVGLGIVLTVGLLVQAWAVGQLFAWGERLIAKVPLVKTIYGSIKDMMGMFKADDEGSDGMDEVVLVEIAGSSVIGFVTRKSPREFTGRESDQDSVAAYLPMSYQMGGFMVIVPSSAITPIDMSKEDALRLVVTAGMAKPARAATVAQG